MNRKNDLLQSYADEQWDGDRRRAVYELLFHAGEGAMDPYVDGMNREDATFVYHMMRLHAIRSYGSEAVYKKALEAEALAHQLKVTTDDVRAGKGEPGKKRLLIDIGILSAVVVLPPLISLALTAMDLSSEWLFTLQSILITLCSLNVTGDLLARGRYRKLKKLLSKLPEPSKDITPPTFEECLANAAAVNRHR